MTPKHARSKQERAEDKALDPGERANRKAAEQHADTRARLTRTNQKAITRARDLRDGENSE